MPEYKTVSAYGLFIFLLKLVLKYLAEYKHRKCENLMLNNKQTSDQVGHPKNRKTCIIYWKK